MTRISPVESLEIFGAEVRELRKAREMTLADLAQASGVSLSHLSAIERGAASPTLTKIAQIADGLGVPEDWFFARREGAGPLERTYVVRRENRRKLNMLYGASQDISGYSDELLSSSLGGAFHMGISEYAPHSEMVADEMFARAGEQHALVLEGELTLTLEDEVITLKAGDSFSFPAEILHATRNKSDQPARLIWANAPVVIPQYAVSHREADPGSDPNPETEKTSET